MGLAIEVLIVDWPRVEAAAPSDREDVPGDAAFGEGYCDDPVTVSGTSSPSGGDLADPPAFQEVLGQVLRLNFDRNIRIKGHTGDS